jgi:hypothetical protein
MVVVLADSNSNRRVGQREYRKRGEYFETAGLELSQKILTNNDCVRASPPN